MRYKAGYKEGKRRELLSVSGKVAKRDGFAATGVDTLMKAAGATSGAFYSHFPSKSDLFKALIQNELTASRTLLAGAPEENLRDWIAGEMNRYLSLGHVRHPELGCALPSLAAEIGRSPPDVRRVFEAELLETQRILAERLGGDGKAWALLSQMAGAILIARALSEETTQVALLDACKAFLTEALTGKNGSPPERTIG
ncbi:MAG: TetR/AcrR family transcriptional regulator [Telmatospirillum sp.]|nr:TetR/AcrR family transcriptional regulator [Telmatospirillum sp.]